MSERYKIGNNNQRANQKKQEIHFTQNSRLYCVVVVTSHVVVTIPKKNWKET